MRLPTMILLAVPTLIFALSANHSSGQQDSSTQAQPKPMRIKMGPPIVNNSLLTHPQPVYPQEAKDKRIQGIVRIHVVIGTDGKVMEAKAISGDPLLTQPAIDAVKQWKYRPASLNGKPVEVDTTIDVIFKLNDKKTTGTGSGTTMPSSESTTRMQGGIVTPPKVLKSVEPIYPDEARKKGIEATVEFHAILNKDGSVKTLDLISGDPLFVPAAKEAAKQWQYSRTLINGEPIEVGTTISLKFRLDREKP